MKKLLYGLLILSLLFGMVLVAGRLQDYDWRRIYYPASQQVLHGHSPYQANGFVNPPWVIPLILPLSIGNADFSRGLIFTVSLISLLWICRKLRLDTLGTIFFLFSSTVVGNLIAGNLDAILLPAIFLNPSLGLVVLLIKPQIGIGPALYWLVESYRQGGIYQLAKNFMPLAIITTLSVLMFYPVWPQIMINLPGMDWNRSAFPYLVPLGIVILGYSLYKKKPLWSLAASSFLSPYITLYSYASIQVALMDEEIPHRNIWLAIAFIISWVLKFILPT